MTKQPLRAAAALAGRPLGVEWTDRALAWIYRADRFFRHGGHRLYIGPPFVGACVHVPPPPANQIVHVVMDKPIPFDNMYEPYWVKGTLDVTRTDTDIGTAGYRLNIASITPYE